MRRPSAASTVGVDDDVAERLVAGERDAHHHHARDPEVDDVARRDEHVARVERAQIAASRRASRASRTATAPTRTTCRARRGRAPARPSRTPGSARAASAWTIVSPQLQYQTGSWWPHQSWRETHQGRICSIQSKKMRSRLFGMKRTRPSRTAAIAGAASSCISQNHCSETSGSTRLPEREQCPTLCTPRLLLAQRARARAGRRRTSPRRLVRGQPGVALAGSRRSCARRSRSPAISSRPWRRPISRSFGSWPGVTLSAPVPTVGIDVLVGDDRHLALDQRHDRALADQVPVALVGRVDGDGRCRRAASPAARSRPSRGRRRRAGSRRSTACRRPRGARPRGRRSRWRRPGDQLIIRLAR